MPSQHPFFDIVIVGAGPVGMALAALLRHGDRSVLLVEQRAAPFVHPRAMHLDRTSIELLGAAGVRWHPGTDLDELAGVSFDAPSGASFPIVLGGLCPDELAPFAFSQPAVEAQLRAVLAASTVEQRHGTTLTALTPGPDALQARLCCGEHHIVVRTDVLIGCDGANSTVRRLAGIGSRQWGGTARWLAEDHLLIAPLADRVVRQRIGRRPVTIVPGCASHVRVERCLQRSVGAPLGGDAAPPPLGELIGVESKRVIASRAYTFTTRLSPVPGRVLGGSAVLLAGDAAHTVAPFLGQGLGLGLRDAANLAALLLADGTRPPGELVAAHRAARRGDVRVTAVQARAAQLLIERGASMRPATLDRTLRALAAATRRTPGLVRRAALAHRPEPFALSAAAPLR